MQNLSCSMGGGDSLCGWSRRSHRGCRKESDCRYVSPGLQIYEPSRQLGLNSRATRLTDQRQPMIAPRNKDPNPNTHNFDFHPWPFSGAASLQNRRKIKIYKLKLGEKYIGGEGVSLTTKPTLRHTILYATTLNSLIF